MAEYPVTESISDISKVDSRLAELYQRAAGAEGAGTAAPTVRTILVNLIVYASSEEQAEQALVDVSEIAGTHPCRAIIVESMPPRPDEASNSVSVICGITDRGDRRLCGEVIHIHIHEKESTVLGSVMPLLVADVPVVLWIPGDIPESDKEFFEIIDESDRIIVDSYRFSNLEAELESVVKIYSMNKINRSVQDLSWTSIHSWRELTAQHFDAPAVRPYLRDITDVRIKYSNKTVDTSVPPAMPLLFAAWFINRLELNINGFRRTDDGFVVDTKQDEREVKLHLVIEDSKYPSGKIVAVDIECNGDNNSATFTTQRVSDSQYSLTEECVDVCLPPRVIEIKSKGAAGLIAQTLDICRSDQLYDASLAIACSLLTQL